MIEVLREFYVPLKTSKQVWLPNPSWANHANMLQYSHLKPEYYRYYDLQKRVFTYNLMLEDLNKIPE